MNALTLVRRWSDLSAPSLDDLVGTWRAEFVAPLRHVAPVGLGPIGLPRWYGKRFANQETGKVVGVNIVRRPDGLGVEEKLPMEVVPGRSVADGEHAIVVTYGPSSVRPWRWVSDELRMCPDGKLAGLSFVTAGPIRRTGLPLLLSRD